MKNKIVAGQTVFIKTLDARTHNQEIIEAPVSKVGKKYFEIENLRARFYIDTLFHDGGQYSSRYKAYLNKQDYLDEVEFNNLWGKMRNLFSSFGKLKLSIAQLREINAIINKSDEEQDNKAEGCKVL